jgi:hypothetical protein
MLGMALALSSFFFTSIRPDFYRPKLLFFRFCLLGRIWPVILVFTKPMPRGKINRQWFQHYSIALTLPLLYAAKRKIITEIHKICNLVDFVEIIRTVNFSRRTPLASWALDYVILEVTAFPIINNIIILVFNIIYYSTIFKHF